MVEQLLTSGFKVTVLTRKTSAHTLPASVTVKPVDYESLESVTEALKGQDAVVSNLSTAAVATQLLLVKAAAAAHVKRFIPSEFGSNTQNEKVRALPLFKDKITVQEAVKNEVANGMSYTLICTGAFLDWGIKVRFIMDLVDKKATLYDGGDRPFSATTVSSIGKAVASVLQNPEKAENRFVYVSNTSMSLKRLVGMGKKAVGADGWTEDVASIDDQLATAWAELKKEKPNPPIFIYAFIRASLLGEGYGGDFGEGDNKLLGIEQMSDEQVQNVVNGVPR